MTFKIKPCTLNQANDLVRELHRHHKPCQGHRFSLDLYKDDVLCGVVICGRPVARHTDPNIVLEVTRCATDGTKNAISKLYGAVCRAAEAMGFESVQTFTLPVEGGASMKASGFSFAGETRGGQWVHTDGKPRRTDQPTGVKHKWVKVLTKNVSIDSKHHYPGV